MYENQLFTINSQKNSLNKKPSRKDETKNNVAKIDRSETSLSENKDKKRTPIKQLYVSFKNIINIDYQLQFNNIANVSRFKNSPKI